MNPWKRRLLSFWYSLCFVFVGWIGYGALGQFFLCCLGLGKYPMVPPDNPVERYRWLGYYTAIAIFIIFFIPWSMRLFNKARLYGKRSKDLKLSDIQQNPQYNPYVLYLRSFDADKEMSKVVKHTHQTEEEVLVQSLSPIGKTVAIGCPADPVPPLGGYRIYVSDDEWQGTVKQLSKDAKLTVLRLGQTQGVGWEIDHALTSIEDLRKLIFLIPDIEKTNLTFFADLEKAIREKRPDDVQVTPCTFHKQGWGSISSIIYFEKNENGSDSRPTYILKQSFVPKRTIGNFFGNFPLAFEKAMFPVYQQFGKLSFMKKFTNAVFTHFTYILLLICICYFSSGIMSSEKQSKETVWYRGFISKIETAEKKYPKLADALKGRTNNGKIAYITQEEPQKILYLNDEHLVEVLPASLHITKCVLYENKSLDDVLLDLPLEEMTKLSDNMLRAMIMHLVPEEREDTSVFDSPEIYQDDNVLKVCSSLTEEQKATVNNWLSSRSEYTMKDMIDFMEFINGLPDQSVKAFLFRAFYYYNNSEDVEQ